MPEEQLLYVDFKEKDAFTSILPRSPLLSSYELGWDGIQVQAHKQPAWEMPKYCPTQHILTIHHLSHPTKAERVLDGRMQHELLHKGDVALISADVSHKALWSQECDFTLLLLEPTHIATIAHEIVDVERVKLIPHFSKPDPLIYQIGIALASEIEANSIHSRLYVDSLTTALAAHLIRHYSAAQPNISIHSKGLPQYQLSRAIEYIHDHLAQDIKLIELATAVGMSQYYFCRLFKQSMGISPHQYLIQQRVERAKQLLRQRKFSIADIALQCGFTNQSHLNRYFKRLVGVTPNTFLNQIV